MEEKEASVVSKRPRPHCKNCGEKLSKRGNFCPSCSQRDFDGRVRMRDLLAKFFSNITHLDNKFVKMCWQLFIPARVTIEYFQGKIKRYPHPVQFFFIVMFFFLLVFSQKLDGTALNLLGGSIDVGTEQGVSSEGPVKVSKSTLFPVLQRCMTAREYRQAYDSLPIEMRTQSAWEAQDSIHRKLSEPWEKATQNLLLELSEGTHATPSTLDSISLDLGAAQVRISTPDFVGLEPDSIIKKYGFTHWMDKLLVKQGLKSTKDQKGLNNRCVGSLGWTILMLIAFMAFVLQLLYWRKSRYYVEHFIFLMHQQSGMFLFLTLVILLNDYVFTLEWEWLLALAWMVISPLLSMKYFYRENWPWTIAKWLAFSALYWFGLMVFFIGTVLLVFVVF